jgi:hypothetical protein
LNHVDLHRDGYPYYLGYSPSDAGREIYASGDSKP